MSNELKCVDPSGFTCYAVIVNAAGEAYNGVGFESPTSADWGDYAVTLTEQSTCGIYLGDMPSVTEGAYNVFPYEQQGDSPTATDLLITNGARILYWNGISEVNVLSDVTVGGYASGQSPAALVWNALLSSYKETGSFGYAGNNSWGGGGGGGSAADNWNYLTSDCTIEGSTGAALVLIERLITLSQQAAPVVVPAGSLAYQLTQGDTTTITDNLLTLNGALVDMTTVASVQFAAGLFDGALTPVVGPVDGVVNDDGTVSFILTSEITSALAPAVYRYVRWIATLTGGGQIYCMGALYSALKVYQAL